MHGRTLDYWQSYWPHWKYAFVAHFSLKLKRAHIVHQVPGVFINISACCVWKRVNSFAYMKDFWEARSLQTMNYASQPTEAPQQTWVFHRTSSSSATSTGPWCDATGTGTQTHWKRPHLWDQCWYQSRLHHVTRDDNIWRQAGARLHISVFSTAVLASKAQKDVVNVVKRLFQVKWTTTQDKILFPLLLSRHIQTTVRHTMSYCEQLLISSHRNRCALCPLSII